tara:strand:+ start:361 stop:549 length:189 start_codon:yes stop_codon:yes gene_type:complete
MFNIFLLLRDVYEKPSESQAKIPAIINKELLKKYARKVIKNDEKINIPLKLANALFTFFVFL